MLVINDDLFGKSFEGERTKITRFEAGEVKKKIPKSLKASILKSITVHGEDLIHIFFYTTEFKIIHNQNKIITNNCTKHINILTPIS